MIAPERVAVSSFGRRRSLSDLAVWGFPEFSRKIFPLKPFSHPFPPLFLPLDPFLQFLHPSKPSPQLSRSGFFSLSTSFTLFLLLRTLPSPFQPFLGLPSDPLRTPPESLPKASKKPQKAKNTLFRGFPPKPPKRAKIPLFRPFLTPFSPLPYPL